jgi:hypothetical protein
LEPAVNRTYKHDVMREFLDPNNLSAFIVEARFKPAAGEQEWSHLCGMGTKVRTGPDSLAQRRRSKEARPGDAW